MTTLNTMFNGNANTMFNNERFNSAIICRMDREISDQMHRLYDAALKLKGISGKSAVATFLGLQSQHLNNWENGRPISNEALLTAQEKLGCDALWLRDGKGDMIRGGDTLSANDLAQLVLNFGKCDASRRKLVLAFSESQAIDSHASTGRRNKL